MFALHNSFTTGEARKVALSGEGVFKPAALVVNDLAKKQGIFIEYSVAEKSRPSVDGAAQCHWFPITKISTDESGITLHYEANVSERGKTGDGVNFLEFSIVEKQIGPFHDDDLVLISCRPAERLKPSRFAWSRPAVG